MGVHIHTGFDSYDEEMSTNCTKMSNSVGMPPENLGNYKLLPD